MHASDRRSFLKAAIAVMGGMVLGESVVFAAQHRSGRPLRVGASLPLSGPGLFAEDGLRQLLAYRLWQEERNADDGLLGRRVDLTVLDDANDPDRAVAAYRRLIDEEGVDLLLGNYGSGLARVTIPVVEDAGMPCVFPMAWQPALWTQGHRWAAPLLPLATEVAHPLLDYHVEHGVRRVALIWAGNDYARDLAESVRQGAATRELELVFEGEYGDDAELLAVLEGAHSARPDLLAGGNLGERIPHVVASLGELELNFPAYAWFELDEPVLLEHRDELEGMTGFGLWLPSMPFEDNARFVHDFAHRWEPEYPKEAIGLLIDHHSSAGYAAAQLTQSAVEAAGTVESSAVRDALFGLDTETIFGPFRLDERGIQVGKNVPVVGYRQGLRETLWPPEIASV